MPDLLLFWGHTPRDAAPGPWSLSRGARPGCSTTPGWPPAYWRTPIRYLPATGARVLVEASPYDAVWASVWPPTIPTPATRTAGPGRTCSGSRALLR